MRDIHLGKGGGGQLPAAIPSGGGVGHGGGGHGGGHHGGFHHWGGGPGWRGGPWAYGYPWAVPTPSYGIDLEQLLLASEAEDQKKEDTKALAKEIVKQIQKGKAAVGEDLDLLDADILGEDSSKPSGGGGGGGMFGDFGLSSIFNLAGNLAQGGLNIAAQEQAKKDAAADKARSSAQEQGKLQAAISADAAAAQAMARAAFSASQKLPSAPVDKMAADQAASVQARAGAALSPEAQGARIDAANKALSAATGKAQASPKDAYALALMSAWQQTINKIQSAQITGSPTGPGAGGAGPGGGGDGGSGGWLSRKTGPVPNKVIAGAGVLGVGGLLVKVLLR